MVTLHFAAFVCQWLSGHEIVSKLVVFLKLAVFFGSYSRNMASQTQGIQQLLAAEKRAAEKVSEARKRKNLSHYKCYKGVVQQMF